MLNRKCEESHGKQVNLQDSILKCLLSSSALRNEVPYIVADVHLWPFTVEEKAQLWSMYHTTQSMTLNPPWIVKLYGSLLHTTLIYSGWSNSFWRPEPLLIVTVTVDQDQWERWSQKSESFSKMILYLVFGSPLAWYPLLRQTYFAVC